MAATFNSMGVDIPTTIDMRVQTVEIDRGGQNEQREVVVLADHTSSLAVASVVATSPASTEYGLVVRQVGYSTGPIAISSIAGVTKIGPSDTSWASSAGFHFNSSGDLKVDAVASTTVQVSSLAGRVTTAPNDTNWASSAGFHFDSSGALNIKDTTLPSTGPIVISSIIGVTRTAPNDTNWASSAGFHFDSSGAVTVREQAPSTGPFVISSITGVTRTMPSDTNWASSAGFHFDGAGALNVAGSFTGSTDVRVSGVALSTFAQNSSAYLAVRLTDGSSFLVPGIDYPDGSTTSTLVGPTIAYNNGSNATMRTVGITQPLPIQLTDSSNAPVKPGDSANNAVRVNVVAGSAAGPISSLAGRVTTAPNDTNWASSAGFHFDSSGALTVKVDTPSTGPFAISSIAGVTKTTPNDTNWASSAGFHFDSSGALNIKDTTLPSTGPIVISSITGLTRIAPNDTNWASSAGFHFDSSGALLVNQIAPQSTSAPSSNSSGIIIRQVIDERLTLASTNCFGGGAGTTSLTIVSSGANLRAYVVAYSITSTVQTATQLGFYSSGTLLWPMVLQAASSVITGVNLSAGQGYLFRTVASEALSLRMNGSSQSGWLAAVSYYVST